MRSIFPSVEIPLPDDWSLQTDNGTLLCQKPHLWVEHRNQPTEESSSDISKGNETNNHVIQGVLLRFQGDQETWQEITKNSLLGYKKEAEGPIFGGSFKSSRPYIFEAILCSSQLTLLCLMTDQSNGIRQHFIESSISIEMQQSASYRLYSVSQPLPENPRVQIGLTMNWT